MSYGGLPPRRIDQRYHPVTVGGAPGTQSPEVIARVVIIYGTNQGVFLYQGTPGLGNPPVLSLTGPATTADPYGNPVTPDGYTVYEPGGVQAIFVGLAAGSIPTIQVGTSGSSLVTINPDVSTPFNITNAISGTLQSALELTTTDTAQMIAGLLGSVLLNSGSATKMSTVLTSPLGSGDGAALVLQAENDGGSDTAVATLGIVTTPDDETEIFSPILALYPYALLLYSGASGQTTVTKTSGSGTITGLPATVKAEVWAPGGGGATAANFGAASAGGGEYAQEPSLATAGSVTYSIGSAGTGGVNGGAASTDGGNTTITGSAVTVTAHGGKKGTSTNTPGAGGTGSTNSVHYDGGVGAGTVGGGPNGAGGGGSAGTSGPGNAGQEGKTHSAGSGGAAVTGGGAGGSGGTTGNNGQPGTAPGGGGGGSSAGNNGGNGSRGQARVSYTIAAPSILLSVAASAGTDQFGSSYPAGFAFTPGDGNVYNSGPALARTASTQGISAEAQTALTGLTFDVQPGTYYFRGMICFTGNAAQTAYVAMGGTCTESAFVATIDYSVAASDVVQQTTFGSNTGLQSAALVNGGEYRAFIEGFITVSGAGTLLVNAATSANSLGWTSQPGSLLELIPVSSAAAGVSPRYYLPLEVLQPSGDTSGATDAANIMAAVTALPATGGTIWLAPGIFYVATGTVVIDTPQVKIKGMIRWGTLIHAVGTGDCIRMYNPSYGGNGLWGGGVEDVTIDGSLATAPVNLLHIGDMEQMELNVAVQNATGGGCFGVLFDNTIWWTEKLHGIVFARNCDTHAGFNVSGVAETATDSFGYLDLTCYIYVQPGQDGVVLDNGARPYHGRLTIKGNVAGTDANAVLRVTGQVPAGFPGAGDYSAIYGCELNMQVESSSSPGPYTIYFGAAGNTVVGCRGTLDFTQGTGTFTATNLAVVANAGVFGFFGPVVGDQLLQPAGNFPLGGLSGMAQVWGQSFMGTNGNTFVNEGDFFKVTLNSDMTVNMNPGSVECAPAPQRKTLIIIQAAAGGPYTVTWPHAASPTAADPTVLWAGGTAPTMSTGASAVDVYELRTYNGATWYGNAIQNVS